MHKLTYLAALAAALAFPVFANADTVTLSLTGTYNDNSVFSGTFVYDQAAQQVISGSIADSSGAVFFGGAITTDPQTYDGAAQTFTITPNGCQSNCNWFGLEFYTAANPTSLPYLDLYFYGDPSSFTGGAIQSSIDYVDYFGPNQNISQEIIGEGLTRGVATGYVGEAAATPEPATLLLLAPAALLLMVRKRRQRTH